LNAKRDRKWKKLRKNGVAGNECRQKIDGHGMLNWQSGKAELARSGKAGSQAMSTMVGRVLNFPLVPMDSWPRNGLDQFQVARLSMSPRNTLQLYSIISKERGLL